MRKLLLALTVSCAALPAWALYKVVGPDGKVTYTDRPPVNDPAGKTASFKPGHSTAVDTSLPAELRGVVSRYPVTLYGAPDCVPWNSGRLMLLQRGIPFAEKRIVSEEDAKAFEQISGSRTLPALAIGKQVLRGLNSDEWLAYLDAAGYPKESRLPAGWKLPSPTPLVEVKAAVAAEPAASATREAAQEPAQRRAVTPAAPPPTSGIRF